MTLQSVETSCRWAVHHRDLYFLTKGHFCCLPACFQLQADCFDSWLERWKTLQYLRLGIQQGAPPIYLYCQDNVVAASCWYWDNQVNGCKSNNLDSCCFIAVLVITVVVEVVLGYSEVASFRKRQIQLSKEAKSHQNKNKIRLVSLTFITGQVPKTQDPMLPIMQLNSVSLFDPGKSPCHPNSMPPVITQAVF